jgi:hypothetical protein
MRVYVAASSDDIDRARRWIAALRAAGVEVTADWPETIASVGAANPRAATRGERKRWAEGDLGDVKRAHLFWLLVPAAGAGRGAYAELGYARALGLSLMASGDTHQSIFCAMGVEHPTDEAAFAEIVDRHRFYTTRRAPADT